MEAEYQEAGMGHKILTGGNSRPDGLGEVPAMPPEAFEAAITWPLALAGKQVAAC